MIIQIQPWINWKEIIEIIKVVRSTFITEGKKTLELERLTKDLTKSKYSIAYANGTLALYAALKSLKIGKGDEVIVPNLTFIATANAVIMAGAKPVFCDVYDDQTMNAEDMRLKINSRTKAVV